jgi:surfeit locus 1 family protein
MPTPITEARDSTAQPPAQTRSRLGLRYWVAVLAGLGMMALALWAAGWQGERAQYKRELAQAMNAATAAAPLDLDRASPADADEHRQARMTATWLPHLAVYLDNRTLDGRVGRIVLMPARTASGQYLLVNRGWVPQGAGLRTQLPAVPTPTEPVFIEGRLARDVPAFSRRGDAYPGPLPALWPNFDWAAWQTLSGLSSAQWVFVQTSAARSGQSADAPALDDGLVRRWTPPQTDIAKHQGYRFQWLAIALLAFGLTLFFGLKPWIRRP